METQPSKTKKQSKKIDHPDSTTSSSSKLPAFQQQQQQQQQQIPFGFLKRPQVPPQSPLEFIHLDKSLYTAALKYRAPGLTVNDRAVYVPHIVDKINQLYCYYGNKPRSEEQDIELQMYMTHLVDFITKLLTCPEDGSPERKQDRRERNELKNFFSLKLCGAQNRILGEARKEATKYLHSHVGPDGTNIPGRIETQVKRIMRKEAQVAKERNSVPTLNQSMQAMQLEPDLPRGLGKGSKETKEIENDDDDDGIDVTMGDDNEDDDNDPELNEYETEDGDEGDEYSSDELEDEGDYDEDEDDEHSTTTQSEQH